MQPAEDLPIGALVGVCDAGQHDKMGQEIIE